MIEIGTWPEVRSFYKKANGDLVFEAKITYPIIPDNVIADFIRTRDKEIIDRIYGLPKSYIINNGATILFWKDNSKTVVRRSKDDKYDKRLGFLTAYFQKHCGMSKTKANKFLDNLEELK